MSHPAQNNKLGSGSQADELRTERERLDKLAEELQAREAALEAREKELHKRSVEHQECRKLAYGLMIEKALREVPPLPEDVDLATLVKQDGWKELKEFIDEL
jgi:hypothetical protein